MHCCDVDVNGGFLSFGDADKSGQCEGCSRFVMGTFADLRAFRTHFRGMPTSAPATRPSLSHVSALAQAEVDSTDDELSRSFDRTLGLGQLIKATKSPLAKTSATFSGRTFFQVSHSQIQMPSLLQVWLRHPMVWTMRMMKRTMARTKMRTRMMVF